MIEPKKHEKLFNYPDDALVILCEDHEQFEATDKVLSICQYWRDKRYLSEKQKWVLAYFAAYGTDSRTASANTTDDENPNPPKGRSTIDDDDIPF